MAENVVFLDPGLTDRQALQAALLAYDPGAVEVVGFGNALQGSLVAEAGYTYASLEPDDWTPREKLGFLTEVYQIYHEVEHHPGAWLVPWPERFPYGVSAGVLLRHRPELGTNLALQVGWMLERHRGRWRGGRAHAVSRNPLFGEMIRHLAPALGMEMAGGRRAANGRPAAAGPRGLRLQARRVQGVLEVARMELAVRTGRGPVVRVREHRSTAPVIEAMSRAGGVRVVPPPRHHPGLLWVDRRLARDRAVLERRFDEALGRFRQDVAGARPPGWALAVDTLFAVRRAGMYEMMQEVARTWWHLDRYGPHLVVDHDWYQPLNHATWSWCKHHGVPFTVMLHGEGGVLTGQLQTRSLDAREVYCWSPWSRRWLQSLPGVAASEVVCTGNPEYDGLPPSPLPATPAPVRSVLVALSAYTGVWADDEIRSWRAIARLVQALPGLRWKIRGHRVSALGDGFGTLFGPLPVEMPDRAGESFLQAARDCDVVVTNLSTARTDAVALGKLTVVWNDLGITDPLNDRPGMVVVGSEAELKAMLSRLAADPAYYAALMETQIAGTERELLPSAGARALEARIRALLQAAGR